MNGRSMNVLLVLVIGCALIGYFVGISDGVPNPGGMGEASLRDSGMSTAIDSNPKLVEAISYGQISETPMGPTKAWQAEPQALPQPEYDLYTKVDPSESEKAASSQVRSSRRAFNGAPPVISHPVENTTDAACYACHGKGVKVGELKASVMSHRFLGNCVQCHAPMAPAPFREIDATVASRFVGLPAPRQGKRAYKGAPPTIPHSQWMRENCNACHGGPHGWAGMESTHPWRTNCTQCHAPSASLDQMPETESVPMLPPLEVVAN